MDETAISSLLRQAALLDPGDHREDLMHEVAHMLGQDGQDCLAELRWHNAYRLARGWALAMKRLSTPRYPLLALERVGLLFRAGDDVAGLTPLGVEVAMFALL